MLFNTVAFAFLLRLKVWSTPPVQYIFSIFFFWFRTRSEIPWTQHGIITISQYKVLWWIINHCITFPILLSASMFTIICSASLLYPVYLRTLLIYMFIAGALIRLSNIKVFAFDQLFFMIVAILLYLKYKQKYV